MPRFLTYNIHGCIGRGGREDPEAVLEVIRRSEADVVALQEVYDHDAADLSFLRGLESLDYPTVIHGRTLYRESSGHYGNILMSRTRPSEIQRINLDVGGAEPRAAVRFSLELPEGPVSVCGTHLSLNRRERLSQLRRLDGALVDSELRHGDVLQVLMGDLNEWLPAGTFMRALRHRFPRHSRRATFPARLPLLPLDRIALRGRHGPVRFRRLDAPPADRASDHRPLLCEVEMTNRC